MVESNSVSICKHCKKQIKDKAKLVGFSFVCPFCNKPSEDISLGKLR